MPRNVICLLQLIGLTIVLAAPAAWAQEPPPVRIRGTIERVDGSTYLVNNRDGNADVEIQGWGKEDFCCCQYAYCCLCAWR
jgi:hypothetical protein